MTRIKADWSTTCPESDLLSEESGELNESGTIDSFVPKIPDVASIGNEASPGCCNNGCVMVFLMGQGCIDSGEKLPIALMPIGDR